ncbi:tumor necrosis factor receptor superfamily member 13B isoform X2 [Hemicordylus capensis]|uniref:tumor necrosis factor receptor superfamily member 13B isoform X2 n=1 Tax=Hemicordylus capensis TaxID=884348 RepID=UPI002302C721|nr:tumor necrosis factor receptor superfamily member 13B isoform X2 [Hemicordylus capensis]
MPSFGSHLPLEQTMLCSKEQYWDQLTQKCSPCRAVSCHPPKFKQCADICSSMDCSKRAGFYYDTLLRRCIDCSTICGQHPRECLPFCRNSAATLPVPAAFQCKLDSVCDQRLIVYLVVGLCLCTLLFSLLLMWISFRKQEVGTCRARTMACHKMGESTKDRLVEAGSMGSQSSGSQTPEPVETCGFCFPEQSPAVQETRAGHRTYPLGAHGDVAGTVPASEDSRFPIICSPSQEKMQVA